VVSQLDAPIAVADSAIVDEDGSVLVPILDNDSDVDSPTLSILRVTPDASTNGTFAIEGSQVRFTPSANSNGTVL
jgi:hypothetical protein